MKFKEKDVVKARDGIQYGETYDGYLLKDDGRLEFLSKPRAISHASHAQKGYDVYQIGPFIFTDSMLEMVTPAPCEHVFKCEKCGISLADSTAPTVREVRRPAKVGEWVKVVNGRPDNFFGGYKDGEIYQAICVDNNNIFIGGVSERFHAGTFGRGHTLLSHDEYVVLEGYTPPQDKQPEKPKGWNGRVVCINSSSEYFDKGKVYEYKNGLLYSDKIADEPYNKHNPATSKEEALTRTWVQFIEFKG